MKFFLMKMSMIISTMNLIMKNPMSMGMSLLTQTMIMIMIMNKMTNSSWFPMTTFLMMIGGLMILFSYMWSIASNEKFKMNINITLITIMLIMSMDNMMIEFTMQDNQKINNMNMELSMTKMYNKKSLMITIMMAMYLLITMISSSCVVKHNEGPLRNKS